MIIVDERLNPEQIVITPVLVKKSGEWIRYGYEVRYGDIDRREQVNKCPNNDDSRQILKNVQLNNYKINNLKITSIRDALMNDIDISTREPKNEKRNSKSNGFNNPAKKVK